MQKDTKNDNQLLIFVNSSKLGGVSMTGAPKNLAYKDLVPPLKNALTDLDYVFSSIIQVYRSGAIENGFPTFAIAYDSSKIDAKNKYDKFYNQLISRIEPVIIESKLPINILVLDRRDKFLKHFKKSTSWIIDIADQDLYDQKTAAWWRFWK